MPAPSIGPNPVERLCSLLTQALLEGRVEHVELLHAGARTADGFDEAWDAAMSVMKAERAYPHRTVPRHQWQEAINKARPEWRASYLRIETAYSTFHEVLLREIEDRSRTRRRVLPGHPADEMIPAELVA